MLAEERETYFRLCGWTLNLGDAAFVHQHVVDAFAAQHADAQTKPITLTFALVGLYLCVEKRWSGRQVQRAHMQMAGRKRPWPAFAPASTRGSVTASDVMSAPEGPERLAAVRAWCESVWGAYRESRSQVIALLAEYGIV